MSCFCFSRRVGPVNWLSNYYKANNKIGFTEAHCRNCHGKVRERRQHTSNAIFKGNATTALYIVLIYVGTFNLRFSFLYR